MLHPMLMVLCLAAALPGLCMAGLQYSGRLSLSDLEGDRVRVLDTRALTRCTEESLDAALCLPPEEFFGPHHRLASIRDIAWVLGTAGLRGDEAVHIIGDDPIRRDVVAALLYLAGQSHVDVVTTPAQDLFSAGGLPRGAGRIRGMVRAPIYQARAREKLWLLRADVAEVLQGKSKSRLLDGRSSAAYWGKVVRGARGGHLPGAESAPDPVLRQALAAGHRELTADAPVIAYAHDAYRGLAYLTLLRAGLGLDARLYVEGWREWSAADGLPIDAATYPDQTADNSQSVIQPAPLSLFLLSGLVLVGALSMGFLLGRRLQK